MSSSQPPLQSNEVDFVLGQTAQIESSTSNSGSPKKLAIQEEDHKFKDNERGESYRKHIHLIVVIGMYVVGFIMIFLIGIRAWHLGAPVRWHWLNNEDTHAIEKVVFSGIILTLASKYFKRYKVIDDGGK